MDAGQSAGKQDDQGEKHNKDRFARHTDQTHGAEIGSRTAERDLRSRADGRRMLPSVEVWLVTLPDQDSWGARPIPARVRLD
ncbi:hypothetical protein JCM9533A_54330 [Catenuloplanes niger JCM 9533]